MSTSTKREKIIWAVDSTQNPSDSKNVVEELKIWSKHLNCDIQPVSIFSTFRVGLGLEIGSPWREHFIEYAHKSVDLFLKKTHLRNHLPPELLFIPVNSTRKMATELAHYAEKKNALLICAYTRAKKSWNPFRMGSFAETLVATSKVPVLLLNPLSRPSVKIPNILFPTDFSRESRNALVKLEPWAKAFQSQILLFNQVTTPNFYSSDITGTWQTQTFNLENLMDEIEKAHMKKAISWSKILKKQQIDYSLLIRRQQKPLGEQILDVAKEKKVNLIALASLSGPITQAIIGSIARDIMLQAKCPILVFYRPKSTRHRTLKIPQKTSPRYKSLEHAHSHRI